MIIDAVRLPLDIERGVKGGPQFSTSVLMTDGGVVSTNQNWQYPLWRGAVGYGVQTRDDLNAAISFFWARRGRARGFLFRDWSDFNLVDEVLGTGDGVVDDFQIVRNYGDTVAPFVRNITRPVESGTGLPTLQVSINGSQIGLSEWSLQPLGIVHFTIPPALGEIVTINGVFDIPVHFGSDTMETLMELEDVGSIPVFPIIEVREGT